MSKISDGWGILNIKIFGVALICKSLWRGIYGTSLWSDIVRQKYLKGRGIEFWFRFDTIGIKRGSAIWYSFRRVQHYFLSNLKWEIHTGNKIYIGLDSFAGYRGSLLVPPPLLFFLRRSGLFTWNQIIKEWDGSQPVLRDADDISLPFNLIPLWSDLSSSLQRGGLQRSTVANHLTWSLPFSAPHAIVKDIYSDLISVNAPANRRFPVFWWKLRCPLKIILFSWLVLFNKNLTWDSLRRRSWHGPSRCALCKMDEESNFHLFFKCSAAQKIWYDLANFFSFQHLSFISVDAAFNWWGRQKSLRPILPITLWSLWRWRNLIIFEDSPLSANFVLQSVSALYSPIC